eukprot:scaffold2951_cov192-Amphora_coffeaeformis.AAC.3
MEHPQDTLPRRHEPKVTQYLTTWDPLPGTTSHHVVFYLLPCTLLRNVSAKSSAAAKTVQSRHGKKLDSLCRKLGSSILPIDAFVERGISS